MIVAMSTLASRVTEALEEKGLERPELARRVGLENQTVHYWCDGKTKTMRSDCLFEVARELDVAPEWLATGKGPKRGTSAPPAQVDEAMLTDAIEHVLAHEEEARDMPASALAIVIAAAYHMEATSGRVDEMQLARILRIVARK